MKYIFLLMFIPQMVMASALVVRDEYNRMLNVVAVINFNKSAVTENQAVLVTEEIDRLLNDSQAEVQVNGVIYTVLFNIDYQLNGSRYPINDSCAHNIIDNRKDLFSAFASGLEMSGTNIGAVTQAEVQSIPWGSIAYSKDLGCLGRGLPLEI